MYQATLTFTKTDDGRVRLEWADTDPLSVFVTADTAEEAIRLIAEHGDFSDESIWLQAAPEPDATPEPRTLGLARRVAVSPLAIKTLIEDAYRRGGGVRIDYVDAMGERTYERLIDPKNAFHTRGYSTNEYVTAYDYKRGEMRSFRLDRIQRAEDVV